MGKQETNSMISAATYCCGCLYDQRPGEESQEVDCRSPKNSSPDFHDNAKLKEIVRQNGGSCPLFKSFTQRTRSDNYRR